LALEDETAGLLGILGRATRNRPRGIGIFAASPGHRAALPLQISNSVSVCKSNATLRPWRTWTKFPAATPSGLRLLSPLPRARARPVIDDDVSHR
jgi:hypothetical protein